MKQQIDDFCEEKEISKEVAENTYEPPADNINTGALITIFGADFISLQPESRLLLSYLFSKNQSDPQIFPELNDLISKWISLTQESSEHLLIANEKYAKKVLNQMEKNRFILKLGGKNEYAINRQYQGVKNLFN